MKCLILCGGRGVIDGHTRNRIPKALFRVGNRPLIWHIMKLYSSQGISDFVLALGKGSDDIKQFFVNSFELLHDVEINISNKNIKCLNRIPEEHWNVTLVDTGIAASTGARIARCERYLKHDSFHITYSDVLADIDLIKLNNFHQETGKTITVTGAYPPSRFGTFVKKDNKIQYSIDKPIQMLESRINGGFMIANDTIFAKLSPVNECCLETEVFDNLIKADELSVFEHDGFWQNVDTERDVEYLQSLYDLNKRPWLGFN
jgi:glucose-1-phosphate cytidylyltransferase